MLIRILHFFLICICLLPTFGEIRRGFGDDDILDGLVPTLHPTAAPTAIPTAVPTAVPTATPTAAPTAVPTAVPTATPTAAPTATPTAVPTATPTAVPTVTPTAVPTATPTAVPTVTPSATPTADPTTTATNEGSVSFFSYRALIAIIFTLSLFPALYAKFNDGVYPYNIGSNIGWITLGSLFISIADLWLDIELCDQVLRVDQNYAFGIPILIFIALPICCQTIVAYDVIFGYRDCMLYEPTDVLLDPNDTHSMKLKKVSFTNGESSKYIPVKLLCCIDSQFILVLPWNYRKKKEFEDDGVTYRVVLEMHGSYPTHDLLRKSLWKLTEDIPQLIIQLAYLIAVPGKSTDVAITSFFLTFLCLLITALNKAENLMNTNGGDFNYCCPGITENEREVTPDGYSAIALV